MINFQTKLILIKDWLILTVPKDSSAKLPSRGQVSVGGKINGQAFQAVLEPDGRASHWMRIGDELKGNLSVAAGDLVDVSLDVQKTWPEPDVPTTLKEAIDESSEKVKAKWHDITPMARWEWVRWINSTSNEETRKVRIEKTTSKLNGSHRRPCCFNLTACTEPYVSKNGQLIESE